jgi:Holliday junction resolvase RusA-like endonuclease
VSCAHNIPAFWCPICRPAHLPLGTPGDRMPIVTLTIPGRVGILKNSKRVIARGRGRRAIVLPSKHYAEWAKDAGRALSAQRTVFLIDIPVEVHMRFYFANRQGEPDLSNCVQGPEDLLQAHGILANDKLIMACRLEKFFGHEPRVEIEIFKHETQTKERE